MQRVDSFAMCDQKGTTYKRVKSNPSRNFSPELKSADCRTGMLNYSRGGAPSNRLNGDAWRRRPIKNPSKNDHVHAILERLLPANTFLVNFSFPLPLPYSHANEWSTHTDEWRTRANAHPNSNEWHHPPPPSPNHPQSALQPEPPQTRLGFKRVALLC